jgi:hypothetical protein
MATLTITTSGADDTRIAAAVGTYLNLGRSATAAEVKAEMVRYLKWLVQAGENQAAKAAIVVNPDIAPS